MRKTCVRLALAAFLLATLSVMASPGMVQAAGVVGTGTPASCTEAALTTALSGGGNISFNCGGAATIVLTTEKMILAPTTLDGAGLITISGNNATRLFVANGVRFTLNNISLLRGKSPVGGGAIEAVGSQVVLNNTRLIENNAQDQGGAIYCFVGTGGTLTLNNSVVDNNRSTRGAGIYNDGCAFTLNNSQITNNLTLSSITAGGGVYTDGPLTSSGSTFSGNRALDGGALYVAAGATAQLNGATITGNGGGYGGGIENAGTLTVTNSLLQGNSVTGSGGGLWNMGGVARLSRTTISGNTAGEGGGVNSYGSHVELVDVNITGNTANVSHGGGIYQSTGTFFVTNATISGNRATDASGDGGGVYQSSDNNLTLTNVTISQNQAGHFGGGFYHKARFAILTNVTLARNTALAGNAIYEEASPTPGNPGIIQMRNSVIFGNANNCGGALFESLGHNISAGSCVSLTHATDQHNLADAKMGALSFNGGSFAMQTIAPLPGSPAIDAGDATACPTLDQRGAARAGVCDVGALEYGVVLPRIYVPLVAR